MLLDFHLARPPLEAGDAAPTWLGGTPEYMAPELAAAVEAVRSGSKISVAIDGRADIYSLGLLLREALDAPVRSRTSRLPTGLADMLTRCTASVPTDRYSSAAQLAADLRRHLADLPLKGVPNRSLPERWRKWRRRHPLTLPGLLVLAAVLFAGAGIGLHTNRQIDLAATALREGETHLQNRRYAESLVTLRGGEALLCGVPFSKSLAQRMHDARLTAERAQTATELHQFCDTVRPLYATEVIAPTAVREAETRCREMWTERHQIANRLAGQPTAELDRQWRADLLDLGILTAHLHVRLTLPGGGNRRSQEGSGDSERSRSVAGAKRSALSGACRSRESSRRANSGGRLDPRCRGTAPAHCVGTSGGRAGFPGGRRPSSSGRGVRAVLGVGAWFAVGTIIGAGACSGWATPPVRVPRSPRASHCPRKLRGSFTTAVWHTEADRLDWAHADFDRALALDPKFAAAFLGRAIVHHRAGRHAEAFADLRSGAWRGIGLCHLPLSHGCCATRERKPRGGGCRTA